MSTGGSKDSVEAIGALAVSRRRLKCELSPSHVEIDERLLAGESPPVVARWLKSIGEDISGQAVRNYLKSVLLPSRALRQTYYRAMHLNMKQKVDALQELYNLVAVMVKRLSIGLKQEQAKDKMQGMVGKDLDLLRRVLCDVLEAEMDLGIRTRVSVGEGAGEISKDALRDILEKIPAATATFPELTSEGSKGSKAKGEAVGGAAS